MTEIAVSVPPGLPASSKIGPKTREFFARAVAEGGNYTVIARELWPTDSNPTRKAAVLLKKYPGYLRAQIVPHTEKLLPRALRAIQDAMEDPGTSLKDRADVAFKFVAMADKFHLAAQGQVEGRREGARTIEELVGLALEQLGPERARVFLQGAVDSRLIEAMLVKEEPKALTQ